MMRALIFDLDGTLVDTVYAHVLAFQTAFMEAGVPVESWRIHRHVGMSGDLLTKAMMRHTRKQVSAATLKKIEKRHGTLLRTLLPHPPPLPGAHQLLSELRRRGILHGIATSGKPEDMAIATRGLRLAKDTVIVHREHVAAAKPEPDLFIECQKRLGVEPHECYVVGDAIWDLLAAQRAGMLSLGLLTGGYGTEEMVAAGAYRVFENPARLLEHLDELGLSGR